MTIISRPILKVGLQSQKDSNTRRLTTGSVGWNMLKRRLQIEVGRMWSCTPLLPGRIPRNAKKTARGEPMQKKFSTCNTCNAWGNKRHSPWETLSAPTEMHSGQEFKRGGKLCWLVVEVIVVVSDVCVERFICIVFVMIWKTSCIICFQAVKLFYSLEEKSDLKCNLFCPKFVKCH